MRDLAFRVQAAFWWYLARPIPTYYLQGELSQRERVTSQAVPFGGQRSISVSGPAIVTVNID